MLLCATWFFTDNHRECTISLHPLIGNNEVETDNITCFKCVVSWDTVHNLLISTDTNNIWKIGHRFFIGWRCSQPFNFFFNPQVNFKFGHTNFYTFFYTIENSCKDSTAFSHCLDLSCRFFWLTHSDCARLCASSSSMIRSWTCPKDPTPSIWTILTFCSVRKLSIGYISVR